MTNTRVENEIKTCSSPDDSDVKREVNSYMYVFALYIHILKIPNQKKINLKRMI